MMDSGDVQQVVRNATVTQCAQYLNIRSSTFEKRFNNFIYDKKKVTEIIHKRN